MQIFVEAKTIEGMEVPANSDPEGAEEAVECGAGKSRDEAVAEGAGEGLLGEGSVGVVEACI